MPGGPVSDQAKQPSSAVLLVVGLVFLVLASRKPSQHRSLILFTAWSSLVHAGIMAIQAARDSGERGHFAGDVPILAIVGVVLLLLVPRTKVSESAAQPGAQPDVVG